MSGTTPPPVFIPHIDVHVGDKLCGNVLATLLQGQGRHISVPVPVPVHRVNIRAGWRGVLHPCGGHQSYGLS